MKVVSIKNLKREEVQIFYLRKYTGDAVLELPTSTVDTQISFSIETSPLGTKSVVLNLLKPVNYPLIPLKKALTQYILQEDTEGRLPC